MAEFDDLVRPSRDGDQFHYHWAARRCLAMLAMHEAPTAITVEGVPLCEGASLSAGLDAIDVAEYHGSAAIETATQVRYLQLKHSTRNAARPWPVSGVTRTLAHFAERYTMLVERFGVVDVARRVTFEFLTNRPIAASLSQALALLRAGSDAPATDRLAKVIGLTGERSIGFCRLLTLTGNTADFLGQRDMLERESGNFLPERDRDAVLKIKELVTRRATSEFTGRPEITRLHVLEAIGASERDLFPASNRIEPPGKIVEREQLPNIVAAIVAARTPVILSADGGVGKSVLTTRLAAELPAGSETFVYDCFGNGSYRSATEYRHRPRDGLVQLANEMAARRLADPLVPSATADAGAFLRAFKARVGQASALLASRDLHALLVLIIDAADNAEMAAEEAHDGHSFARLMMREVLPDNVRLVLTVRPHRADRLDPPANTVRLALEPFSETETAKLLRSVHREATDQDVLEFHRLTSQNPRVQATALAAVDTLDAVLARLGTAPLTVDAMIEHLLEGAVARLRDDVGAVDRARIDHVFTALATLRPFVPLDIVAQTADVPVTLVRSIVNDLAHPLLVRDDAVQFRDEPTETWFRERFRPPREQLSTFIARLRPLASRSAYVAGSLPQLMLAAGQLEALIALALADADLPENDQLARRDVQLQRLQFAIKAAIRTGRHADAAALAMKAGRESAADQRQQRMLSANTDFAGRFLEPGQMLEQVSRRLIQGGGWTGSEHAYEAAFLSGAKALHGDARSQLRIAMQWLGHWASSAQADRGGKRVEAADVAEIALAVFNLHGPDAAAAELRRWHAREVSFAAGRILASRLADAAQFDALDRLAGAAGNDIGLLLAVCIELGEVGRVPPRPAVARALAISLRPGIRLRSCKDWHAERTLLEAVAALVDAALSYRLARRATLARLLERYLPADPPEPSRHDYGASRDDRHLYLRGYALRDALRGRVLDADRYLAPVTKRKHSHNHRNTGEHYEARQLLSILLPWHNLRAGAQLSRQRLTSDAFTQCLEIWRRHHHPGSRERSRTADEVAKVWGQILDDPRYGPEDWAQLLAWRATLAIPLFIPTELGLARRAARRLGLGGIALDLAAGAVAQIGEPDLEAESQIESCIGAARAVLPVSVDEARAYFDRAVHLSGRVGEENVPSWEAVLDLGAVAIHASGDRPEIAYRFARAGELTRAFCARDKYFDWQRSIETLAGLSPRLAPAQLSRWIDRGFGSESRILPDLVEAQLARGNCSPAIAIALEAFAGNWDRPALLKLALEQGIQGVPQIASDILIQTSRRDRADTASWSRFITILDAYGLDAEQARTGLAAARAADAVRKTQTRPDPPGGRRRRNRRNYGRLFLGLDPTCAADLTTAATRLSSSKPPFEWRQFYSAAMRRVPPGQEARFVDALAEGAPPRIVGLSDLFQALPQDWQARAAVAPALERLVRGQVRRESRNVYLGAQYEQFPWARLRAVCGLERDDIAREAVTAIGEQPDPLGTDALFRLVSLLAALMEPAEAEGAMCRALDLYEPLFESGTGDGPWSTALKPDVSLCEPWAGFLWAALGAPSNARRWEAAHAVRRLAALGQQTMLADLVALARAGNPGPFADGKLRFYEHHARLWLAIALSRAAIDHPTAVLPYAAWLEELASTDMMHLLLRGFAASALLALGDAGALALDGGRRAVLAGMARGSFVPQRTAPPRRRKSIPADARFGISHDVQRHDVPELAEVLDVREDSVIAAMQKVINSDWGLADRGRWDEDARALRRLYPDTGYGHGGAEISFDDLNSYLSYHALHVSAGDLIAMRAAAAPDRFAGWLAEQGLSVAGGGWRADRRDPCPVDLGPLPQHEDKSWPASPRDSDADAHLHCARDWVAVDARFARYSGQRRERVTIASALVSPEHARALARAYRSSANPWGADIPDFGEKTATASGFWFEGWLARGHCGQAIDRHDPHAAELGSSWVTPGLPFQLALRLRRNADRSTWYDAHHRVRLYAEQWSDGIDSDMIRYGGGSRLVADQKLVERLVAKSGKTLLVHVRVERDLVDLRHSTKEKDAVDARIVTQTYLYEAGTGWWRPGSPPPARRRASQGTRPRRA